VAEQGTLHPGAVLLRGSRVSKGAGVERAIVWENARVPSAARVSDMVWW
jgi:ADP-glucose pyrophosphorylase